MTVGRIVMVWLALAAVGCGVIYQRARIDAIPGPPKLARAWVLSALNAARKGAPVPKPPEGAADYRGADGVIVDLFHRGVLIRTERAGASLVDGVMEIVRRLRSDPRIAQHPGWGAEPEQPIRFAVAVPLGDAPFLDVVPGLDLLGLVPLREGVSASVDGRTAHLSPHAVWALAVLDEAVVTPIPDLSFGADVDRLRQALARKLGVPAAQLRGKLRRFVAETLTGPAYPADEQPSPEALRAAARQGAAFLLRHQRRDGRFTYVYDARADEARRGRGYSLARHAGTTFFLAQAARLLDMPEAREGARRALRWVRRRALTDCGQAKCVGGGRLIRLGGSALTALATAEWLRGGTAEQERKLLEQLTAHIRAVQRPDGELMHDYDRKRKRPIDRQRMYYSGEAALALLRAHRVLGDARDLATVASLMRHLTGGGWSFFGSRYFYGEEHWTCQAVAAGAGRLDVASGLDFCLRWSEFQRRIQYGPTETQWPAWGAYGVGPVLLPRITAIASRVEAGVPIYRVALARGDDVGELRTQLAASVSALMRFRWSPGPIHLMKNPAAALGGFPMTQASLQVRNDFVQHAGSAMLAWAEQLSDE
ncbi:MAG: hypothetical protein OXU20_09070 [Myxococcales bacterium]|nr:hypothetical protein [Myxococcales bacterium]